jgi:hypothetical protein
VRRHSGVAICVDIKIPSRDRPQSTPSAAAGALAEHAMRPPTPSLRQTVLLSLLIPALAGCGGGSASAPSTAQDAHGGSVSAPSTAQVHHGIKPGATETPPNSAPSAAQGAHDIKPGVPESHSSGSTGKLTTSTVSPYMGAYAGDETVSPEQGPDGEIGRLVSMLAIDSGGLIRGYVKVVSEADESWYLVAGAIKPGEHSATLPLSAPDGHVAGAIELVFGHDGREVSAKLTHNSVIGKPVALFPPMRPDAPIGSDAKLRISGSVCLIDDRDIPGSPTDTWTLKRSTTGASTWTLLGVFDGHSLRATLTPTGQTGWYRADVSVVDEHAHPAQQVELQGDGFVSKYADGQLDLVLTAHAEKSFIWVEGEMR